MSNVHVYVGIENLALTVTQRNTLVAQLQAMGVSPNDPQPARRNHWRIRLDNQAAIFEALWDEDTVTLVAIKARLAAIFGISAALISHTTQQTAYGLLVTFTYQSTARLRLIRFGAVNGWPDWETSRQAVLAYLAANKAAWGDG